jgi:PleD family two-component response regulator
MLRHGQESVFFVIGISRRSIEMSAMPHVLLVEDEPAIADTLVYALQTECFTVTHALTGADALAAASSGKPGLSHTMHGMIAPCQHA